MLLDFHSEVYSWIRGGLFVLFVYHFLIFFQNKSKLYLFYSLYLLAFSIYLLKHVVSDSFVAVFNYINFPIQFFGYAAYIAFARELLDTRTHITIWDKYFEFTSKTLLALGGLFFLLEVSLGYEFQVMAFTVIAPLLTVLALISYYIIIDRINDSLTYYFVFGSLIYVVLANISFIEFFTGAEPFIEYGVQPMFFVYLGTIFQSMVF